MLNRETSKHSLTLRVPTKHAQSLILMPHSLHLEPEVPRTISPWQFSKYSPPSRQLPMDISHPDRFSPDSSRLEQFPTASPRGNCLGVYCPSWERDCSVTLEDSMEGHVLWQCTHWQQIRAETVNFSYNCLGWAYTFIDPHHWSSKFIFVPSQSQSVSLQATRTCPCTSNFLNIISTL